MDPAVEVGFRQRRFTGELNVLHVHGKMVCVLKGQSSFFIYCALPLLVLPVSAFSLSLSLFFLLNTYNVSEAALIHGNVNI